MSKKLNTLKKISKKLNILKTMSISKFKNASKMRKFKKNQTLIDGGPNKSSAWKKYLVALKLHLLKNNAIKVTIDPLPQQK